MDIYFDSADSTNYVVEQRVRAVGDSSQTVFELFEQLELRKQIEARSAKNFFMHNSLNDPSDTIKTSDLLESISGLSYYDLTSIMYNEKHIGDWELTIAGTVYDAEFYTTATGILKVKIADLIVDGVTARYNVRILSKKSFEIRGFEGTGNHVDFFFYLKRPNGRKVFNDIYKKYKAVKL